MGLLDLLIRQDSSTKKWLNHRNLYLLGLATIACGLGWSNALMSIGQLIIIGNWFIELGFKNKLQRFTKSPLITLLLIVFLLHLTGLMWTDDFHYAWKDLRVKLPLLALPVIIGTSNPLKEEEWKLLLKVYTLTLFSLTISSYGKYFGLWGEPIIDKRELSIYISHIRYGLNLTLVIGFLFYFKPFQNKFLRWIFFGWFLVCLVVFQLYTGLGILVTLFFLFLIYTIYQRSSNKLLKLGFISILLLIVGIGSFLFYETKEDYYSTIELDYDQHDFELKQTINGEYYWVDIKDDRTENGVLIRRFIAWGELEKEWNKRSQLNYKGEDLKGNAIEHTLNRFLSSKGLKKDSVGVSKLSDLEIQAVEKGIANIYYLEHNSLQNRIYKSFFEFEEYKRTGNASGFSLAMRYEFWKTAKSIIQQHFWIGTGTGDVEKAFKNEYIRQESKLEEVFRRRTHNQYLTIFATFGIIGLCLFLSSLFLPIFYSIPHKPIYLFFLGVMCMSFFTEDTLETQAGVTLFAFFNCLLVLGISAASDSHSNNGQESV